MSIQKIAYFIYFAKDMDRAKAFYTNVLGLKISADRGAWVQFEIEGGTFALHQSDEEAGNNAAEAGGIIGFHVDNLDGFMEELKAHQVKFQGEIREERFGRLLNIFDPDGNIINLLEPAQIAHTH